ncbi:unnamed protein product [Anisakis simplex]|uniref:Uncharacterized protein n=1 Tax=Anisakis simplex TaxID=6269 RepID=A0A0M3J599_ANISI|nr:unnamed protein product [Anisakis simplex]
MGLCALMENSFQIAWSKQDDEGFYENICNFSLAKAPPDGLFVLIRSLLSDRIASEAKALNAETQLSQVQNQLQKLDARASEMKDFCANLETRLISKFTTILNEKLQNN